MCVCENVCVCARVCIFTILFFYWHGVTERLEHYLDPLHLLAFQPTPSTLIL